MAKQTRISLFALITLLTLLANLMFPASVLADDEVPPSATTEETTLPEESEAETPSDSTEDTTLLENSEIETPPQEPTGEPAPVSETLEQLPENTELIVLDENGEALPLVTEEAEEAIIIGDPVWCPSSLSAPTPGINGCTTSYTSFQALITYLDANEQAMDGTIWIESTYNSSVNDAASSGFVFNGGSFATMRDYSLTIQGGWNGVSGSSTIGSASIFSGDYLHFVDWNANITINNISVDNASAAGVDIVTTGDINLNNVASNDNIYGAALENCVPDATPECTGSGNVNLNNVVFNDNDSNGLQVISNGEVNITNIIANGNGAQGVAIINSLFTTTNADVIIDGNNQFNSNGDVGLSIFSNGNINVSNSEANDNGFDGFYIDISGAEDITLNNVIASNNAVGGLFLDNSYGTGNVFIKNSQFNNNGYDGIEVYSSGSVTLNSVIANNNLENGVNLDNSYGTDTISIINSQFNNNGDDGIDALSAGNITLNNVIANGNFDDGADLENCGCAGTVGINIFGSVFSNNAEIGLTFFTDGSVHIENTTVNNNGLGGIGGDALGDITVINTTASGNPHGLGFATPGNVTIKCSTVTNNSLTGVEVYSNNLDLIGSTVTNNGVDYLNGVGTVNVFDYDCNPSTGKPKPSTAGLPLNIVFGNSADLDCDLYSGTTLILPNGDKVTFKCPITGSATLNSVTNDGLPNELPEGVEYVSGFVANQSPDGSDLALDGLVVVSFVIPEDMQGEDFAILYWDGTEWLDLDTATFEDGRKIFNGGYITEDGYFEALTNFSGNFVLVTK